MKQACIAFPAREPRFDILTGLAHHGGGELLDHIARFVADGRTLETQMVISDESGWTNGMRIARHGRMLQAPIDTEPFELSHLHTVLTPGGTLLWMSHGTVSFTGIVSGGMLHLTAPPPDLEVVQLSARDTLSINTFVEVDSTLSDRERHFQTYYGLLRRGIVFIRKADGSISVSLGQGFLSEIENASLEVGDEYDLSSSADVREMIRKMAMPVQDGVLHEDAPVDAFITLDVISKAVVLKTKVQTFGKLPVAFRLDSMEMAAHAECAATNLWSFLVPKPWIDSNVCTARRDPRNTYRTLNRNFTDVASAVVDHLILSNSSLVPSRFPDKRHNHNDCSIFDYTKVRRTPEGCRVMIAPLRKMSPTSSIFARMCMY